MNKVLPILCFCALTPLLLPVAVPNPLPSICLVSCAICHLHLPSSSAYLPSLPPGVRFLHRVSAHPCTHPHPHPIPPHTHIRPRTTPLPSGLCASPKTELLDDQRSARLSRPMPEADDDPCARWAPVFMSAFISLFSFFFFPLSSLVYAMRPACSALMKKFP
jgi:hypothetical protein